MSKDVELSTKKIALMSSDGEIFEIEKAVAVESNTIKNFIEDFADITLISIHKVNGKILAMVIKYCKKHVVAANSSEKPSQDNLKKWDTEFVQLEQHILFDLILAADFLGIKSLLDLTYQTIAGMMRSKKPKEIRQMFNIVNDYSLEEDEKVRRKYQWVFE